MIIIVFIFFFIMPIFAMEQASGSKILKIKADYKLREIECKQIDHKAIVSKEFIKFFEPLKTALDLKRSNSLTNIYQTSLDNYQRQQDLKKYLQEQDSINH